MGKFTVFHIKGNQYRLITVIHYNRSKTYARAVMTHKTVLSLVLNGKVAT